MYLPALLVQQLPQKTPALALESGRACSPFVLKHTTSNNNCISSVFSGILLLLLLIIIIIITSGVLEHKWRASLKLHYCYSNY